MDVPEKTPRAWRSRDTNVGIENDKDEMCDFTFTARGFNDLLHLYDNVSYDQWAEDVPKSLPILIISGSDDPIGGKGEGVTSVYESLKEAEVNHLTLKLYEGARHELVNETNK